MDSYHLLTQAIHSGIQRSQFGETSEAIFLTQGFVYDSAEQAEARFIESKENEYVYARYGNPTVRMFEKRIASLNQVEDAFATSSGMAAVNSVLFSLLSAGDHMVSSRALFGSCLYIVDSLLPRFGVNVTLVDGTDPDQWKAAIRPDTKAVFLEAVSNPTLEVIDIGHVVKLAKDAGAVTVVDNAMITPLFFPVMKLGVDIIIYSATKHIDGQGRCLGGVVLGSMEYVRKTFEPLHKHTGGAMSPFNAWIMLKGLETLSLRCNAQADSALAIARGLESHTKLCRIIYPHLKSHPQFELAQSQMSKGGTVFSIDVKGGKESAFRFLNALKIIRISNNFGDTKSLVTHPATTTHQRLGAEKRHKFGITDGLVRISIGLEDTQDLLHDLLNALKYA